MFLLPRLIWLCSRSLKRQLMEEFWLAGSCGTVVRMNCSSAVLKYQARPFFHGPEMLPRGVQLETRKPWPISMPGNTLVAEYLKESPPVRACRVMVPAAPRPISAPEGDACTSTDCTDSRLMRASNRPVSGSFNWNPSKLY